MNDAKDQIEPHNSTDNTVDRSHFPERTKDTIEETPLALPKKYCSEIIEYLDGIVSGYFTLFHLYQKHHWLVEGPQYMQLHKRFEAHYKEVHEDMDEIAERLVALGGIPTCKPSLQEDEAMVQMEQEGKFPVRSMLKREIDAERAVLIHMRKAIRMASFKSDFGTETILKKALVKMEERIHHIDHFLSSDSLLH